MARDRAKEKIQAQRKAKQERKVAKVEQRHQRATASGDRKKHHDQGQDVSLFNSNKDSFGNSCLLKVAFNSDSTETTFCEFLENADSEDIDILLCANKAGVTLTHVISLRGWVTPLEKVIKTVKLHSDKSLGAVVNATTLDGMTPLMLASEGAFKDVCIILLSNGANPLAEDKTGYSALCRCLSNTCSSKITKRCLPPTITLIITAINNLEEENWDFEIYFSKIFQNVINPPSDASFTCERFYSLGRFVFLFILRCVERGPELFLKFKFFKKLCSAANKRLSQANYIYTICLTWFQVLVNAEDFANSWGEFVETFAKDGADFCLKMLIRFTTVVDAETSSKGTSFSKLQSKSSEAIENAGDDSLVFTDNPVPSYKNVALSALLPLIQLIDAIEMSHWFSKNFATISSCYRNMGHYSTGQSVDNSALSEDHLNKLNKKSALFHAIMNQDKWTVMYQEKNETTESWIQRDKKHKKKKQVPSLSSHRKTSKVVCFPFEILRPPMSNLQDKDSNEETEKEGKLINTKNSSAREERDVDKATKKIATITDTNVETTLQNPPDASAQSIKVATISPESNSRDIHKSPSNSDSNRPDLKFVKDKLGPDENEICSSITKPLEIVEEISPLPPPPLTLSRKQQQKLNQRGSRHVQATTTTHASNTEIIKKSDKKSNSTKLLAKKETLHQHIFKFDIKTENEVEFVTTHSTEWCTLLDADYLLSITPRNIFSLARDDPTLTSSGTRITPSLLSLGMLSIFSMQELKSKICDIHNNISNSRQKTKDRMFQAGWSTCCDAELWRCDRNYWKIHLVMCVSPDGLFVPVEDSFISKFYNLGYQTILFNEGDYSTFGKTHPLLLESSAASDDDYRYFTRRKILYNALSTEYLRSLEHNSVAFRNSTNTRPALLFTARKIYQFGLHHWEPSHFSKKYVYKSMSRISREEMWTDFHNTYPTVSPFCPEPAWTAFGHVTKSCSDLHTNDVYVPIIISKGANSSSSIVLQLELAFEAVYMSEFALWSGIYRQIPSLSKYEFVAGFKAEYKTYYDHISDGYVQTTLIGMHVQNGGSSSSPQATKGPSTKIKNKKNAKTPNENETEKLCVCCKAPMAKGGDVKNKDVAATPRTRKTSVYENAEKFRFFHYPRAHVTKGLFVDEKREVRYPSDLTDKLVQLDLNIVPFSETKQIKEKEFKINIPNLKIPLTSSTNLALSKLPENTHDFTSQSKTKAILRRTVAVQTVRRSRLVN
ncbi:uncharacterized protein LOC118435339 isoform X2 [Folsomia candida]|uniref:uncharacterized protein LOC118435339 isoform X2 n=1 Tax=Folsomia candida TaxID=158441 RepID=UPI001604CEDF|nr:uncharacterized protein LOC118435339 isoform X2 [Folsomia candida]